MPRPDSFALIDTLRDGSVSFAPPDPSDPDVLGTVTGGRANAPLGAGRLVSTPAMLGGASRDGVSGYPIQVGKVQRPPLREETLARHRLLDWLDVKIHNRVVFVIADAGYGKTTLLADFSRRTRLRTLWYRMDEEDRNWVTFLSYLVAAGREHDDKFAPRTSALLEDTGPGGATVADAVDALIRELPSVVGAGCALVLDDFHVAEGSAEIRAIVREIIARGPERLTLIVSSRRQPGVPVARLRATGEIAELRSADLRFSADETNALFKKSYGQLLDSDVVSDLAQKTEGWVASLALVGTALRGRSPSEIRAFVRQLSGAHAELHDYLAEEVVGELAAPHQAFLMRTSLLQGFDLESAVAATGFERPAVQSLMAESERLGLVSRRLLSERKLVSYHPLVREFLTARLRRDVGDGAIAQLHRELAEWAQTSDWRMACYHYAAAGLPVNLHRVIRQNIDAIVGSGEIALASRYLSEFPPEEPAAEFEIVRSRFAGIAFDFGSALDHARKAIALDPTSDSARGNLLATYFLAGDLSLAADLAAELATSGETPLTRFVGQATFDVIQASLDGPFRAAETSIDVVLRESRHLGLTHYLGVALLDKALLERGRGNAPGVIRLAGESIDALGRSSSGSELIAAMMATAWAHAHLGNMGDSRMWTAAAGERAVGQSRREWLTESAEIETMYGDEHAASAMVEELLRLDLNPALARMAQLIAAQLAIRQSNLEQAREHLPSSPPSTPVLESGFLARYFAVDAQLAVRSGEAHALDRITYALSFAERQGADLWAQHGQGLLVGVVPSPSSAVTALIRRYPASASAVAEVFLDQGHTLDGDAQQAVFGEATRRPERWRESVRRILVDGTNPNRLFAARLLDVIGEASDVRLLRTVARSSRGLHADAALGRGLARRLAKPVMVEDLGRVEIRVGQAKHAGSDIRRKVLAMLTFLLTRPKFSATRDEVIDAIWPDLDPDIAVNSLNQTVYFLRRIFEPEYKEETSAGYVRHDSDVVWLDEELISSRSKEVRALIDQLAVEPNMDGLAELSRKYVGRFALDFMYEEWAVPFRDALHVGYLQVIEGAVVRGIELGQYEDSIELARRALVVDPDSESLQVSLLQLLREIGAHSAAAEQYAHYASYVKSELGIEPPPVPTRGDK